MPLSGNIANRRAGVGVKLDVHDADWSFDQMLARVNPFQVSERNSDADHPVAAHSQVTCVIEKDHSCCACRIERLQQQGSYNYVRSPWLAEDRTTIQIVALAKFIKPVG